MAKKALLVGINDYKRVKDLRGCHNDVRNMRYVLKTYFGFENEGIRVLTDRRATKAGIMRRLEWLVEAARPGDHLVFHFSGHGSQIRDRSNDELEDYLDELLCPYDMDWDGTFILDDDLDALFRDLKDGVLLEVFLDCCHSGTGTKEIGLARPESMAEPEDRLSRYLEPPVDIMCRCADTSYEVKGFMSENRSTAKHVLWAGCADFQTSADAHIENDFNGAFTYYLCRHIRRAGGKISRGELLERVSNSLYHGRFNQRPQLECGTDYKRVDFMEHPRKSVIEAPGFIRSPRKEMLETLAEKFGELKEMSPEDQKKWFDEKRKEWFSIHQTDAFKFFYDVKEKKAPDVLSFSADRDLTSIGKPLGNFFESFERHIKYQGKKNSGAVRVVAEGDSWFLHPLVKDIIDHIHDDYAVSCLSAAGDELKDMIRQDDYVDEIASERPAFFLLSAGGNDVLGENVFSGLLENYTPGETGMNPERFLKPDFKAKLWEIRNNYLKLFNRIGADSRVAEIYGARAPLHALIHGYDYVIPGTVKKGTWLHIKMKAKGIVREVDQNALLRHVLDEFNKAVGALEDFFAYHPVLRVHHVDLRGTLERVAGGRPDKSLWYDEIHPNDKGYKIVADEFNKKMAELTDGQ